jgi:hypothetical protein
MIGFGPSMLDMVLVAYPIKEVAKGIAVGFSVRKLDAIIGEYGVDGVWHHIDYVP